MRGEHYFRMNNTAFVRVIVGYAVPLIDYLFTAAIGGSRNGRFAFSPADYLDMTMIYSDRQASFFGVWGKAPTHTPFRVYKCALAFTRDFD